ncbi:MAG: sugar ABC transporter permease [Clostridia bacterium]|nr:sugar ABC transporter permease [Clostridia bacterium]
MVDSKQQWKAWIYLAPALVLLAIFTVWPIINTSIMAFQEGFNEMDALRVGRWGFPIGLGNFEKVLKLNTFKTALSNTIILCIPTVLLSTLLALIISVCLNSIKAFNRFLQTIYFLPYVTNSIAIGMVFAAMFNIVGNTSAANPVIDSYGIINTVLDKIGIEPINWINSGSTYEANMAVMIIYIIWNALPFKILVLLGALQSVNKQYYDAAKVDGTGKVRTFTRITVPLLSPMITYVVITGFIGGFKEYSSIVGVFGDDMGPTGAQGSLNTMVGLIYEAIEKGNTGNASAAALILFGIIFIITMINLAISKKTTYY